LPLTRIYIYGRQSAVGIFIRNSKTEAKVRKLAKRTRRSLTATIDHAVEQELARMPRPSPRKGHVDREKLAEVLAYFDSLPVDDPRTHEDIIGYDEHGVPK
jgi:antitoxin VapB